MNFLRKVLFIVYAWLFISLCFILRIVFKILFIKHFKARSGKKKSIVFLAAFYPENAGYHYRVLLWKKKLEERGRKVDILPIFSEFDFRKFSGQKDLISFHFRSYYKRFIQVLNCLKYDTIVVRRSLLLFNDYGNLFLDKFLLSFHPRVVLDFDDDLSNNLKTGKPSSLFGILLGENRLIFYESLKIYSRFMPGSNFLKALTLQHNHKIKDDQILVLPTCVDYDRFDKKQYDPSKKVTTFGWIGSNANQMYLDKLIPVLNQVSQKFDIELLIISGKEYLSEEARFQIINTKWSLESEVEDLYQIDIGLMPLENDKIAQGKCGFKLIQYMGLGIVSIASSVTANAEIVEDGVSGFLVYKESDWEYAIIEVLNQAHRYNEISESARNRIRGHYSFEAHIEKLNSFL